MTRIRACWLISAALALMTMPAAAQQAPTTTQGAPATTPQTPATAQESPAPTQQTPATTQEAPAPAIEMSACPEIETSGLLLETGVLGYFATDSGSQDNVRMYDGNRYSYLDLASLRLNWFSGDFWGRILAWDITNNNPLSLIKLNYGDIVDFSGRFERITHRLAPIPLVDPNMPGDSFLPIPGEDRKFETTRDWQDMRMYITPPGVRWARLVGEYWSLTREGDQQLLFRSRSNRQRYQGTQSVDQTAIDQSYGIDLGTWGDAFNYRHFHRRFWENAPPPTYPAQDSLVPIKVIVPDTRTDGNMFQSFTDITGIMRKWIDRKGQRTWYTERYSTKDRKNRSAQTSILTAEPPVNTASLPREPELKVRQHNLSLTHMHGQNLLITGRYRHLNYDNMTPFLTAPAPSPETGEILNQIVKRRYTSFQVDSTYTGLSRLTLRGSYEYQADNRDIGPVHPIHEEFSHGPIATDSNHNVFRVGANFRPMDWAYFRVNSRWEHINAPIFNGSPENRWDLNSELTLSLGAKAMFLANYSEKRDKNSTIPPPGPLDITNPDFTEIRDAQGGAQYNSLMRTWDMAVWASPFNRLTIDVHAGRYDVRSRAFWVLGTDPNFLPIIEQPEYVPYNVRNLYLQGSLTYEFARRWKFRADLMHSDSRGQTTTYSLFSKVPNETQRIYTVQPVDVRSSRDSVGIEYEVNRNFRIVAEHSWNNWRDHVDESNTGSFRLLSLGFWYYYQ